jgi:hypothetical protein
VAMVKIKADKKNFIGQFIIGEGKIQFMPETKNGAV